MNPLHTLTHYSPKTILILSSHLRQGLPRGIVFSGFQRKILYFLPPPRAMHIIISRAGYKLWSSSLCTFLSNLSTLSSVEVLSSAFCSHFQHKLTNEQIKQDRHVIRLFVQASEVCKLRSWFRIHQTLNKFEAVVQAAYNLLLRGGQDHYNPRNDHKNSQREDLRNTTNNPKMHFTSARKRGVEDRTTC